MYHNVTINVVDIVVGKTMLSCRNEDKDELLKLRRKGKGGGGGGEGFERGGGREKEVWSSCIICHYIVVGEAMLSYAA